MKCKPPWTGQQAWKTNRPAQMQHETGCLECRMTGYQGRVGIYEIMVLENELRNLITDTTDMEKLRELSYRQGMKPLRISAASAS